MRPARLACLLLLTLSVASAAAGASVTHQPAPRLLADLLSPPDRSGPPLELEEYPWPTLHDVQNQTGGVLFENIAQVNAFAASGAARQEIGNPAGMTLRRAFAIAAKRTRFKRQTLLFLWGFGEGRISFGSMATSTRGQLSVHLLQHVPCGAGAPRPCADPGIVYTVYLMLAVDRTEVATAKRLSVTMSLS